MVFVSDRKNGVRKFHKNFPFISLETNYEYIISRLSIPSIWIYGGWTSQESFTQLCGTLALMSNVFEYFLWSLPARIKGRVTVMNSINRERCRLCHYKCCQAGFGTGMCIMMWYLWNAYQLFTKCWQFEQKLSWEEEQKSWLNIFSLPAVGVTHFFGDRYLLQESKI